MNLRLFGFVLLVGILIIFSVSSSIRQSGATSITIILSSASDCATLIRGQNATMVFTANTCIVTASVFVSPIFLTNSSTTVIVPQAHGLRLVGGYGFANYGRLNNSGIIIMSSAYINYGTTLNYNRITVNNVWLQLNTTSVNALTGLFTNFVGATLTISSTGFFVNANSVINLGTIVNSGCFTNSVFYNSTFIPSYSGNAVSGNAVNQAC